MGYNQTKKDKNSILNTKNFFKNISSKKEDNFKSAVIDKQVTEQLKETDLQSTEIKPISVQEKPQFQASFIAADVTIHGNIQSEGVLNIKGKIHGDVTSNDKIEVAGEQIGNLDGHEIVLSGAAVEGNICALKLVEIDKTSKVRGDVRGETVLIDGIVAGSVFASGLVSLRKNSCLNGDLEAGSLAMEEGAIIAGKVNMVVPALKNKELDEPLTFHTLDDLIDHSDIHKY